MHKVYDPRNFVPGVLEVAILEDDSANKRVLRKMVLNNLVNVVEEITWDEEKRLVDFKLIEHPTHTGNVINRVDVKGENEFVLFYAMDWTFKGEGVDPIAHAGSNIKPAVIKSVQMMEAAAAAAASK